MSKGISKKPAKKEPVRVAKDKKGTKKIKKDAKK